MIKLHNITLEITNKCNFKCKHCCNDSGLSLENSLTKEEILNLINQAGELKTQRLSLTGGEPLCDPYLFNYLKEASKYDMELSLSSNGFLIDAVMAKKLKEHNVALVAISIDGTESYHNNFRGNNAAFNSAISAVKHLTDCNIKVKVRSVVTKHNRESILNLMDITNNLPLHRHEIIPMCPIGRAEREQCLTNAEYLDFVKLVIHKVNSLDSVNITFQIKPVFGAEELFKNTHAKFARKSLDYRCDALTTSLEITSDGYVIPCSFIREPVGNVKNNSISEIYKNKNSDMWRTKVFGGNIADECKNCKKNKTCTGGCYAHRLYGNCEEKKDIYCWEECYV